MALFTIIMDKAFAALLELKDQNGVVKAQIGTAIPLLACTLLLIYVQPF